MRLGYSGSDFPDRALSYADEALTNVLKRSPSEMLRREACTRVPFLVVAIEAGDKLAGREPAKFVDLARALVELSTRIPILDENRLYYRHETEKAEFRLLTQAVLVSALISNGNIDAATKVALTLQPVIEGAGGDFLRAEVRRRISQLSLHKGEYDLALEHLDVAFALFQKLERPDMCGLCALRRGTVMYMQFGAGRGAESYAAAVWFATKARRDRKAYRDRADRISCAAALNLAREWHSTRMSDDREISRYVRAAWKSIQGPSAAKATALMIDGLIAARSGATREANRLLMRALEMFVSVKAYSDAAACIAHMLEVRLEWEPESAGELLAEIEREVSRASEEGAAWIPAWLASRSPDMQLVASLREEAEKRRAPWQEVVLPRRTRLGGLAGRI